MSFAFRRSLSFTFSCLQKVRFSSLANEPKTKPLRSKEPIVFAPVKAPQKPTFTQQAQEKVFMYNNKTNSKAIVTNTSTEYPDDNRTLQTHILSLKTVDAILEFYKHKKNELDLINIC